MKKEDGVSSVVGEMLMLVIVVILAALFAVGAMNFLPGEREDVTDITADFSHAAEPENTIIFTHRGGDVLPVSELKIAVYQGVEKRTDTKFDVDGTVFDLGGTITLTSSNPFCSGDEIRISTDKSIVYAGRIP